MRETEINLLLQKAEELKALFVLGQRVIPFLEEIFIFIREITPILDSINVSIEENLAKMPKASSQLQRVTEATELATTEILDILDGLSYKADIISTNLKQYEQLQTGFDAVSSTIFTKLQTIQDTGSVLNSDIEEIKTLLGKARVTDEAAELRENSEKLLSSLRMDSSNIMMALQVQDITSQQIAAVNHLLQTVQHRLAEIMKHFRNTEIGELMGHQAEKKRHDTSSNVIKMHREIAFDADAVDALDKTIARQDHVEEIVRLYEQGGAASIQDSSNQNDIDALFSGTTAASVSQEKSTQSTQATIEKSSQNDIDALFANGFTSNASNEATTNTSISSQDDIDALFGNTTPSAPTITPSQEDDFTGFSQDDIDALFNNGK